jgi:hypothetical protein
MTQVLKQLLTFAFALVFMTGIAFAQNNDSSIDQVGNGHFADIDQMGDDNLSELVQDLGKVQPNNDGKGSAIVTQTGNENINKLSQNTFFGNHDATITQVGDRNYSEIFTSNGGGSATVTMMGDDNRLEQYKKASLENQKNDNMFVLDVTGDRNETGMFQQFGHGTVTITGSDNSVQLRQDAGANFNTALYDVATITVDGDFNQIEVDQGKEGVNNLATVELLGGSNDNVVDFLQLGSDHTSTVTVMGSNNQAFVDQQN